MEESDKELSNPISYLKRLVYGNAGIEDAILSSFENVYCLKFKYSVHDHDCRCKLEHECFEYIREDKSIDEDMFQNICRSLEQSRCPHVVGNMYNTDSTHVSLLHAAVALGNERLVSHFPANACHTVRFHSWSHTERMDPTCNAWRLAVLKNQQRLLPLMFSDDYDIGVTQPSDWAGWLELLIDDMRFAVLHRCLFAFDVLCGRYVAKYSKSEGLFGFNDIVMLLMIHDRADMLTVLSKYANICCIHRLRPPNDTVHVLCLSQDVTRILRYDDCTSCIEASANVHFTKNTEAAHESERIDDNIGVAHESQIIYGLIHKLLFHSCQRVCICPIDFESIATSLSRLTRHASFYMGSYEKWDTLDTAIKENIDSGKIAAIVNIIGADPNDRSDDEGAITDPLFCFEMSPLSCVMKHIVEKSKARYGRRIIEHDIWLREVVIIFLYSNPKLCLNTANIFSQAFTTDETHASNSNNLKNYADYSATYTIVYNTETLSTEHDTDQLRAALLDEGFYAFIFYVPLLMECGFDFPMMTTVYQKVKHPLLRLLYEILVSTPKMLKAQCRNVLRRTFPGKAIHEFVKTSDIPRAIREYILLEHELRQFCPSENVLPLLHDLSC